MLPGQGIAVDFGPSRTPVREVMSKLAEERLVEILAQYGSFVAPVKPRVVFGSQFAREAVEKARLDAAGEKEVKTVIGRRARGSTAPARAVLWRRRGLYRQILCAKPAARKYAAAKRVSGSEPGGRER